MFCQTHAVQGFTMAAGSCKECGNETNSVFELCERCSEGFDQCQVCRVDLKSGRDPRMIAAFKSAEAASMRKARIEILVRTRERMEAAQAIFEQRATPAKVELEKALQPLQEKLREANKAFDDELAVVSAEVDSVKKDPASTEGQKVDAENRLSQAREKYGAACRPNEEKYRAEFEPLWQRFSQQVAPWEVDCNVACVLAERECGMAVSAIDYQLDRMQIDATGGLWVRFCRWVGSLWGSKRRM